MPQTVQCPQCKTGVGVGENAGGSRVGCPHCGQSFIVPGLHGGEGDAASGPADSIGSVPAASGGPIASGDPAGDSADDDDDWLNIIDTPPARILPPSPATPSPATPSKPLGAGRPAASSPPPGSPAGAIEAGDDLAAAFDERPAGTTSDGNPIQYQDNYRVRCPHCGTQNDVTASQAGKEIRCRDCFSMVRVPRPPRVPRKVEIDMEAAPAFQFSPSAHATGERPADPFRKSASELLESASRVQKDEPPPDLDVPKIRDWAAAVFGIFLQIGVMTHWLILSTLASVVAFVALWFDSPVLVIGLFAGGGLFAAMVLAYGFAIMQSVANEEETVEDWPVMLEPMDWLSASVFCFAAAGLAYAPGWFIGYMTFGTSLTTVCLSMMSVFVIFPFVLLSMLDMQNIFVPFSADVGRSVTRCEEAWGGFYFSSGIIFFFTFLIFALVSSALAPPAMAVVAIFTVVAAIFVYFAMLGRLAFAIGKSANAEAKANDIESQRQREREQK